MLSTLTQHRPTTMLRLADAVDREAIYRARHAIYAAELGQHAENDAQRLRDPLDERNEYLVARGPDGLRGFISITPPGGRFSLDKYLARAELAVDDPAHLFEVRLLTVLPPWRHSPLAFLLMWGALRFVQEHGGSEIVAIGRREVLSIYTRVGLRPLGRSFVSGQVHYELLLGSCHALLANSLRHHEPFLARAANHATWELPFPFRAEERCVHGGSFFAAIGEQFDAVERRQGVISADVLDAWFAPAPEVQAALAHDVSWMTQTSPPTEALGLRQAIAQTRGLPLETIVVGAGSSDLLFRTVPRLVRRGAQVLRLDPTYGEYGHLLEKLLGCRVEHLLLDPQQAFRVDIKRLRRELRRGYDLVALVNPNNPTGQTLSRRQLEPLLAELPARTTVLIDEAYIDYADPAETLEALAARHPNLIVVKSLSKIYALSGLRVAYLVTAPRRARELRRWMPPWVVSLPAQWAAIRALAANDYYRARWRETAQLRTELISRLDELELGEIHAGVLNAVIVQLADRLPDAATLVERCQQHGLFLRDLTPVSELFQGRAVRIAVKDRATQQRMIAILRGVVSSMRP